VASIGDVVTQFRAVLTSCAEVTARLFRDMKARRIPVRASDVEMKLAAHMRTKRIRSATLVVDNLPCEGPLGCDALVPVILPTGYTLTVHGPNGFVRVYKGGKTSSWLP